jgi:phage shock protein PspC (stress-responsive transcriptional regulator)
VIGAVWSSAFGFNVELMRDRRLERARSGKRIAGVCAGLADYTGVSVTLIRVAFVIFAVTGIGELVYLLLWVFTPKAVRE